MKRARGLAVAGRHARRPRGSGDEGARCARPRRRPARPSEDPYVRRRRKSTSRTALLDGDSVTVTRPPEASARARASATSASRARRRRAREHVTSMPVTAPPTRSVAPTLPRRSPRKQKLMASSGRPACSRDGQRGPPAAGVGVPLGRERVPDGHVGVAGERLDHGLAVAPIADAVVHARQHPRRVGHQISLCSSSCVPTDWPYEVA